MNDALNLSLSDVADKIKAREISPVELAEAVLSRIEATEGTLNAYVRVNNEQAMTAVLIPIQNPTSQILLTLQTIPVEIRPTLP